MKVSRRVTKNYDARQRGYQQMCEIAERRKPGSSKGFTRPGSKNPRKAGGK